MVGGVAALVETNPMAGDPAQSNAAPPVIIPPPPGTPKDPGTNVWVFNSLNKTIKVGSRPLATQGLVIQGNLPTAAPPGPTWPGKLLPSGTNTGPSVVTANNIAVNVEGDQATIFPSGAAVVLSTSGQ